ncbi:hypothetical protein HF086_007159 [Spodoptera exigua]|uniref:Uncharacterized protein n=1 Tax=Spodoptera exigua TaxID=7107 RepID=A0A922MFY0_SPOEX|nr:hypothetical protein HF086_007159 [Spodoptera exigua]
MRWWFVLAAMAVVASALAVSSPRRCAGRLARERLKAAEKIRDKRYFQLCCTPACGLLYRKPRPPPARRYQPFHKTWLGLKYEHLVGLEFGIHWIKVMVPLHVEAFLFVLG